MEIESQTINRRKVPNILVTGTPGTGKTTFCQLLNQSLNFTYVPVGKLICDHKLYSSWNQEFDVPEFDQQKLEEFIASNYKLAQGGHLVDFHTADIFPEDCFDLVILIRCSNDFLYGRLQQRGYSEQKIKENIECEIFDEIKFDVQEYFSKKDIILELRNERREEMQVNLDTATNWLIGYKKSVESAKE